MPVAYCSNHRKTAFVNTPITVEEGKCEGKGVLSTVELNQIDFLVKVFLGMGEVCKIFNTSPGPYSLLQMY